MCASSSAVSMCNDPGKDDSEIDISPPEYSILRVSNLVSVQVPMSETLMEKRLGDWEEKLGPHADSKLAPLVKAIRSFAESVSNTVDRNEKTLISVGNKLPVKGEKEDVAGMKYIYRGRLSPSRSRLVVYRFDPENHQGKPVIALKSGIYVHGMHLKRVSKPELFLSGTFEVLKLIHTTQKYDYAAVVSNGGTGDHVLEDRNYLKSNLVYFGIVVDYLQDDDVYKVVLGPVTCDIEARVLENNSSISPVMLSTSVVCVRLRVREVIVIDGKTKLSIIDHQVTHVPAQLFPETSSETLGPHASEAASLLPLSTQGTIPNLDVGELENLAPTLSFEVRVYENCGIYDKPLVTVGDL